MNSKLNVAAQALVPAYENVQRSYIAIHKADQSEIDAAGGWGKFVAARLPSHNALTAELFRLQKLHKAKKADCKAAAIEAAKATGFEI